jgi:hypothetical protein
MTKKIKSCLLVVSENPTIKSIEMISHFDLGKSSQGIMRRK